ncbi:MAG: lytic transglycosylase domain-containing protein, partial [Deltaproteobacteria bacterium]|nr:lytic transglycosylase domain-containing protein [Deltaproteobacteria bacterium]
KGLLEKYDGDLDHALAAYNWGQGNVDRKGLEHMPTETRNYIAKVKQVVSQFG